MMHPLTLQQLATCVGGTVQGQTSVLVQRVTLDARQVDAGTLFAALVGQRVDGHDFLDQAQNNYASAALVERWQPSRLPQIKVTSVITALADLASYNRQLFTAPLIAVTGNSGKTSVKEMLAAILMAHYGQILATRGNLNNALGVPLTLLGLQPTHAAAVVELGANHLQEIDYLARIAQPDMAIITNVTGAHLGEFGSMQAIATAKAEVLAHIKLGGCLVLNADDAFYDFWLQQAKQQATGQVISFGFQQADVVAKKVQLDKLGNARFTVVTPWGEEAIRLPLPGKHNIANALAAIAAAGHLGVPLATQAQALETLQPVARRLQRINAWGGALVLDDSYNASPDAVKSAIDLLAALPASKKLLALGSLAELGEATDNIHIELGAYARQKGLDGLFALQGKASLAAKAFGEGGKVAVSHEALAELLKPELNVDTCLLVKGSRTAAMDKLVDLLVPLNK
ncbi:MAG TPA: UDP-N-acetylmuramoyl-tripeptide--D-alanyl-D-alanine ligase [Marinospirillum sp.]|uniref:UDP-N-acetylmuramoyl-tripeptide--D-alanyl-D- alanine ligase n=1 Tax=Marinospirillum sp. TaxID=2183934 RepID=UPI002B4A6839|nr:UDP-N-acetylmuramoyl-tripeptide--D-alanyl-D-alanine ligase [Marinospirillum sp.]HKM15453.1 UDP-N-acetylmuramoyl-tripeptide--D-alanyl-D-alanine ligase [Marinospirillum sp.]